MNNEITPPFKKKKKRMASTITNDMSTHTNQCWVDEPSVDLGKIPWPLLQGSVADSRAHTLIFWDNSHNGSHWPDEMKAPLLGTQDSSFFLHMINRKKKWCLRLRMLQWLTHVINGNWSWESAGFGSRETWLESPFVHTIALWPCSNSLTYISSLVKRE